MIRKYYLKYDTIFYIARTIIWMAAIIMLLFLKDFFIDFFGEHSELSAVITWALILVFALNKAPHKKEMK